MTRITRRATTMVVKLGGRAQGAPDLAERLAAAWRNARGSLCVVHGGGDEITSLQRRLGGEPSFAGGRRVTTEGDLDVIRMALSGLVNKRLVAALVAAGAPAVGVSGEDAALISAEPLGLAEFGHVGMPARVNTALVQALWLAGFLPIVSPLAANASEPGAALNVNGDDAAAALAVALGADELLLVADVEGVLDEWRRPIPQLDMDEARALVASGVAGGGMAAKLEAAHAALAGGVRTVRIADLGALEDSMRGTTITLATMVAK